MYRNNKIQFKLLFHGPKWLSKSVLELWDGSEKGSFWTGDSDSGNPIP